MDKLHDITHLILFSIFFKRDFIHNMVALEERKTMQNLDVPEINSND